MQRTGALVLVVGPSGVGKDSLIDAARARFAGRDDIAFPRRIVTRAADAGGEDLLPCSQAEFDAGERDGAFFLSWRAHGLCYGIPAAIEADLAGGRTVVANVSRTVLSQAEAKVERLVVLHVTASEETLARRLAERGRESGPEVLARLGRVETVWTERSPVLVIENDGSLAAAAQAFTDAIARHALDTPGTARPVSAQRETAPG